MSRQHLSISGIYQLFLSQFWPNFKVRFLEPFLIDANHYGDICPVNICLGNICSFQDYLSYYWVNFDQNFFWLKFLEPDLFSKKFCTHNLQRSLYWKMTFVGFLHAAYSALQQFFNKNNINNNNHHYNGFWHNLN